MPNLIPAPDDRLGAGHQWRGYGSSNPTHETVTDAGHPHGDAAIRVSPEEGLTGNAVGSQIDVDMGDLSGQEITLSVYVLTQTTRARLFLRDHQVGDTWFSSSQLPVEPGVWQRISQTVTVPEDRQATRIYVLPLAFDPGQTEWDGTEVGYWAAPQVELGELSPWQPNRNIISIRLTPSLAQITEGETVQLAAETEYDDGHLENVTGQAEWESSHPNVATVDSGLVEAHSTGGAVITARYTADGQVFEATARLTVGPVTVVWDNDIALWDNDFAVWDSRTPQLPPRIIALLVLPDPVEISVGETGVELTVEAVYDDDHTEDVTSRVEWLSSHPNIVTVRRGLVTAHVEGEAVVTARLIVVDEDGPRTYNGTTRIIAEVPPFPILDEGEIIVDGLRLNTPEFLVEQFNPYALAATAESNQKPWGHGSWFGADWVAERTIPMRILVQGHDALHQLSAVFAPKGAEATDVSLLWRKNGVTQLLYGRARTVEPEDEQAGHDAITVSCGFVATDPRIQSAEQHRVDVGLPWYEGGLNVAFTAPFTVDGVRVGGEAELVNNGTAEAPLSIRFFGPVTNPVLVVRQADGTLQQMFIRLVVEPRQYLDIDVERRSVLVDGYAARRASVEGDWPVLQPGVSIARFLGSSGNRANARMQLRWRSAWW